MQELNEKDELLITTNSCYPDREFYLNEQGELIFKDGLEYDHNLVLQKIIENRNNIPMNLLRKLRNSKLEETDKYMLPDYPISIERKNEILNYREALRNLPETLMNSGILINIHNLEQYFPKLL